MTYVYRVEPRKSRSVKNNFSLNTWLILINVMCFVLFSILISLNILSIDAVAIKPNNILNGNYFWTFVTSMFMHGSIFHLFVNMFTLFFIGSLVQKIIGSRRYLYFYLISGLFASLFFIVTSVIFNTDLNVYAVGASGAIFGLIGLLILLTPNLPVMVMFIPIPIKLKYAGPGLLVLLWAISATSGLNIGNTAHLGGLITGVIYGFYLRQKFPNKIRQIGRVFS